LKPVTETMRRTLDGLAVAAPNWLVAQAGPEWAERDARRAEDDRLPAGKEDREQFYSEGDGAGERLHWRTDAQGLPPASLFISSPYDPDVHLARKRTTQWVGYKVQLSETCEPETPNLITHVETTPAPVADGALTAAAVNLLRVGAWLAGAPRAGTRQSAFAALMAGLA
jgi:transposase